MLRFRMSVLLSAVAFLAAAMVSAQQPEVVKVALPAGKPVAATLGSGETVNAAPDGSIVWKAVKGDFVRFSIPLSIADDPLAWDLLKFEVKLEGGVSEVMAFVDYPGRMSWIYRPFDITDYGDGWQTVHLDLKLAEFIRHVSHPLKGAQVTFQLRAIDGERPDQKPWRRVTLKNIRLVKTPLRADWNGVDYTFSDSDGLSYSYPVRVRNTSGARQTVVPRVEAIEAVWANATVTPREAVIAPRDSALFTVKIHLPKKQAEQAPLLYTESFQPFFAVKGRPDTEVSILRSTDLIRLVVIKAPQKELPLVYTTREKLERARRWAGTTDWGKKQKDDIIRAAEAVLKSDTTVPDIGGFANAYYYCTEHRCRLVYEGPGKHKCPIGGEYLDKNFMGVDLDLDHVNIVHVRIIRATLPLAKAYALTGDTRFSDCAKRIYEGYRQKYFTYPPMDLDAQTQTIDKGRTVFAKYMESFNFGDFFMAYDLLKGCGAFTPEEAKRLERELFVPCANEMQDYRMEMSHRQENLTRCAFFMGLTTGHPTLLAFGSSSPYSLPYLNKYAASADGYPLENNEGYHYNFTNTIDEYAQAFEHIGIPMFDHSLKRHAENIYKYNTGFPGRSLPNLGTPYALHFQDPLFRDRAGDDLFLGRVNRSDGNIPFEFPSETVNYPFSGHTVLKHPAGGADLIADFNWASPSQRGEFELLSPTFYAFGATIQGETGQFNWGSTDWHHAWQIMSASHSTIVVDRRNQSGLVEADYFKGSYGPFPSTQLYFSDQDGRPATVAYNDRIYPGVKIWRGLAVIDGAFVMMDRLESETPHTYDWWFHGVPDKSDGLSGIRLAMAKRTAPLGETDGYEIPGDLSEGKTSGEFRADWTYFPGDAAKTFGLSLTVPNTEPVTAFHGFAYSAQYRGKEKEFLMLRRENARNTGYIAVFEPHRGGAKVRNIRTVPVEEPASGGSWRKSERASAVSLEIGGKAYELVLNPTGGAVRTANQTVWEAWGSTVVAK